MRNQESQPASVPSESAESAAAANSTSASASSASAAQVPPVKLQLSQGARSLPTHPPVVPHASGPEPQVLDWAGFRAAVSYTFDDSNSSQLAHYDRLAALEVPFTFYLWTEKVESANPVWQRALAQGHELGNHSHSHQQHGSETLLATDVDRATAFIEEHFGVHPWTMAAPYGSRAYVPVAEARFFINRGVSAGLILPGGDAEPHYLECFVPEENAAAADFNQRVLEAREAGAWEIVLVHGFSGGTDQAYQPLALPQFEQAVRFTRSHDDVWIGTVVDVGAYWLGQQAFEAAVEERSEESILYHWALPEHFPPGKFLRIVSSSRVLSQSGEVLVPSPEGYYDIALDARELRVSVSPAEE